LALDVVQFLLKKKIFKLFRSINQFYTLSFYKRTKDDILCIDISKKKNSYQLHEIFWNT